MITLYRRMVLSRLFKFLQDTNMLSGDAIMKDGQSITLYSTDKDCTLVKDTIAEFHRLCKDVNVNNPLDLSDDGKFIGVIRSDLNYVSDFNDTVYNIDDTLTGSMTFGFVDKGVSFLIPGIFVYSENIPYLMVVKPSFTVGNYFDTISNRNVEDLIKLIPIKDDFIEEIFKYGKENLNETDHKMIKIIMDISQGKYIVKDALPDVTNNIGKLGYNPAIIGLLEKFVMTPLVKLKDGNITEIAVQEGVNFKSVSYLDFCSSEGKMFAVVLQSPNFKKFHDFPLDPDFYKISGKNYYVDDTEWKENENGGYSVKYRVVSESKTFEENTIKGIIVNKHEKLTPSEESKLIDTANRGFEVIRSSTLNLVKSISRKMNDKKMEKLFTKEVLDEHQKIMNKINFTVNSTVIAGAINGVAVGAYDRLSKKLEAAYNDPKADFGKILPKISKKGNIIIGLCSLALASLIAYCKLPKTKKTQEGLVKLYDYYLNEQESANKAKEEAKKLGNLKEIPKINKRLDYVNFMMDRLNREIEKRRDINESTK